MQCDIIMTERIGPVNNSSTVDVEAMKIISKVSTIATEFAMGLFEEKRIRVLNAILCLDLWLNCVMINCNKLFVSVVLYVYYVEIQFIRQHINTKVLT